MPATIDFVPDEAKAIDFQPEEQEDKILSGLVSKEPSYFVRPPSPQFTGDPLRNIETLIKGGVGESIVQPMGGELGLVREPKTAAEALYNLLAQVGGSAISPLGAAASAVGPIKGAQAGLETAFGLQGAPGAIGGTVGLIQEPPKTAPEAIGRIGQTAAQALMTLPAAARVGGGAFDLIRNLREKGPYAPETRFEQESVPTERAGDDALRVSTETGPRSGVQPEAPVQAQEVTDTTALRKKIEDAGYSVVYTEGTLKLAKKPKDLADLVAQKPRMVKESSLPEDVRSTLEQYRKVYKKMQAEYVPEPETPEVVTAATYTNPETGETTTGPNHPAAAAEQGVKAPEAREARETPEYGFQVEGVPSKKGAAKTGNISFESLSEPTGEWEKRDHPYVISKSTIPGDKPWRMTVFGGPKDAPVPIGHIQIDSPDVLPIRQLQDLSEQLGRYNRKFTISNFGISGESYFYKPTEVVSRDTAEQVARESGQLKEEPKGEKVHSDEILSPTEPGKTISEQSIVPSEKTLAIPEIKSNPIGQAGGVPVYSGPESKTELAMRFGIPTAITKESGYPFGKQSLAFIDESTGKTAAFWQETKPTKAPPTISEQKETPPAEPISPPPPTPEGAVPASAAPSTAEVEKAKVGEPNVPLEQAKGRLKAITEQFNRPRTSKAQKADLISQAEEARKEIIGSGGTAEDIQRSTYGTTLEQVGKPPTLTPTESTRLKSLTDKLESGKPLTSAEQKRYRALTDKSSGVAPEEKAAVKAEVEIQKVSATEGQRPAKDVKAELLKRVEDAMHGAPEKSAYKVSEHGYVEINIPGDGSFRVPRNLAALSEMRDRVKALSTTPGTFARGPSGREPADIDAVVKDALRVYGTPRNAVEHLERQLASEQQIDPGHRAMYERGTELLREQLPENILEDKIDTAKLLLNQAESDAKSYDNAVRKLTTSGKKLTAKQQRDLQSTLSIQRRAEEVLSQRRRELSKLYDEKIELENTLITRQPPTTPPSTGEGMVGMGGAVPSEFETSPQTPTSIKNATVDVERAKRGLPPVVQPVRRAFGEVWDRAMAMIDRDPSSQDRLIDSLRQKPRALTDVEDAMLLHRQIDLQNEYGKATRDLAQAYDDNRVDAVAEEKLRVARLSDDLLDLYNIGKKVGTETARGLNARKMMANEDFTLAKMTLESRLANDGRPLSDSRLKEIQELHDKINATQKAYDDYVATTKERLAKLEIDKVMAEQKAAAAPTFDKRILAQAEKIVQGMERFAEPASRRLRDRLAALGTTPDPSIIYDAAVVGSARIARLGLDLAKLTDSMVRDFGEKIRPFMGQIWAESNKMLDQVTAKAPEAVRRAVKKADLSEIKTNVMDNIADKVKKGQKDKITTQVHLLARALVKSGITDREQLIDAVHDVLKDVIPGITRRESMDVISGYGDYKQLTKDQISVTLRGMKGEMQQLAKLEDMAKGQPPLKSGLERRTPTEVERRLIKEVNDAKNKFQVPVQDPNTQLKSALDTLKTTLKNRIADYQERIAKGDYAKRPRREIVLDPTAQRLKAENERVKKIFQRGVALERLKNAQPIERAGDWIVKWRRGFILSSVKTLGKLTTAALQRAAITPAEEAVGGLIGKVIPEVAKRAPREGGLNVTAEAKAISQGITQGLEDASKTLRTGQSDLDILYGKEALLPPAAIDFFGHVHGALKAPVKRAEFARSLEKRTQHAIASGVDMSDPLVQSRLVIDSYKDANRAIFQQDNRVVSAYKRALQTLEAKDKATGQVPVGGKIMATTARVLLPIVKIPTNIVAETMQYALGSVTGSINLARAFRAGIENLHPDQADLIMRQLKKGSLGAAVLALGYYNPEVIGGYYQPGERRPKGTPKPGTIQLYGVNIPSWALHNPLIETLQIGATVRRVADSKLRKKDTENQGVPAGIAAGIIGLGEEVPFVREMGEVTKALNPHERGAFFGELGKSLMVPQFIQQTAQWTDPFQETPYAKRKPQGVVQHIEMGIPGLREQVPVRRIRPTQ